MGVRISYQGRRARQHAFWLSSGNWQSSNQPDVHPFADKPDKLPAGFQKKYNRDYHAIIVNDKLGVHLRDSTSSANRLICRPSRCGGTSCSRICSCPEEEEVLEEPVEFAAPPQLFPPLRLDREVSVQPLLTPDNYAENALKLIQSAKKSVWFQNQYINFPRNQRRFHRVPSC